MANGSDTSVAPPSPSKSDAPKSLSQAPTPQQVRDTELARLKAILSQLRTGLDNSSRSLVQVRKVTRRLPLEDRTQFDLAYAQVRVCEVALRASILAASNAPADKAADAQQRVAADYEAYARAVTVAEATAKASRAAALATNAAE